MTEASKLTIGYRHSGKDNPYNDIMRPESGDLGKFLLQVEQGSGARIAAWHSRQGGSQMIKYPCIRIRLEGQLSDVEHGLHSIVEEHGVPTFVDRPKLPMNLHYFHHRLTRGWVDVTSDTPTTNDAYELMEGLYRERHIKTGLQADNTQVVDGY